MSKPQRLQNPAFQIALITFGILSLELTLIRWIGTQIRVFAYFSNLVLIAAFLGMGLGLALGKRCPRLAHWTLPVLALLCVPVGCAEILGIVSMPFPDDSVALWGITRFDGNAIRYTQTLGIFLGIFFLVVLVFVCAGAPLGWLFGQLRPLRAYSYDLAGSLLGIIAFTTITFLHAPPPVWLAIGGLPFLLYSKRLSSAAALVLAVFLGWYSVGSAVYSPYYRIDLKGEEQSIQLSVNRDFHQFMHDFSNNTLNKAALPLEKRRRLDYLREAYGIPFRINDERSTALIVGAGTGNDVQAALRHDYTSVYSVEIDGRIIDIGKDLHPEKPYDDPRVVPVINDARAFFEQYQGAPFDVICYGFLDSHTMFSSMSSLRLDNYVYTEEGIRRAWAHVSPRGHLSISFSIYPGEWIADRLHWTITRATGVQPIAVRSGVYRGVTFIVGKPASALKLERLESYPARTPRVELEGVHTTSDDWPFLYIRPGHFPLGYLLVLATVLLFALVATRFAFGRGTLSKRFDVSMFFMGAAFLLIETRGVTSLSLLFGSTWLVNAAVFTGIVTVALLANLCVAHFGLRRPQRWFIPLILSVIVLWLFEPGTLNQYPMLIRGLAGATLNALPVGFAGIIVSILLSRSGDPAAALGSNLLGSVVGGSMEYLSMFFGLKALVLMALALYLLALLYRFRGEPSAVLHEEECRS